MKILSQSLKSVESKPQRGTVKEDTNIARGMELKATVIDSSISKVRIMLENGRQLSAKSSVPFENFINEKLVFKVIADEGGVVIRPKLQDANIRHELDMKTGRLIASLGLQDNHESREIIHDMMKLEIPVTKNNFRAISENSRALEVLKALGEEEVLALKSAVAKAEGMELRELGKLIIAEGKGENLKGLIDSLKVASVGRDELLFLLKSGFELSAQNTLNFSGISKGSENILNVFERLDAALTALPADARGAEPGLLPSGESPLVAQHARIKGEIKGLMDDMKLDISKEQAGLGSAKNGVEKLALKLEELIGTAGVKEDSTGELEAVFGKLQLLGELGKAQGYFQLPIKGYEENHVAQLLVKKQREKAPGESERYFALISIGTSNMGNVACKVGYSSSLGYDVVFSLEDERVVRLFKASAQTIDKSLSELGGEAVRISFRLASEKEESRELLGNDRETIQKIPNFDMWV